MELYHCPSSRSLRVIWATEELGLGLEVKALGFPPRVRDPGYFEINPTGTIPTLIDGELALFESVAICEYLAKKAGPTNLVVADDEPDWPHYRQFLYMGEATLVPPLTQIVRYRLLEPKERRLPQAAEDGADVFIDRLKHIEARLQGRDWLAGGRFTLADISVGYALHLGRFLRLGERIPPTAAAYLERLRARPAFARALERN
ncbi:MAG TPA: glutathione S-transferase family protein [Caulobacteraceae bacterium]|jgi:glutathione S-transferase